MQPTPQEFRLMAARAMMPERTIREIYRGKRRARESTFLRVLKVAEECGAPLPPPDAVAPRAGAGQ